MGLSDSPWDEQALPLNVVADWLVEDLAQDLRAEVQTIRRAVAADAALRAPAELLCRHIERFTGNVLKMSTALRAIARSTGPVPSLSPTDVTRIRVICVDARVLVERSNRLLQTANVIDENHRIRAEIQRDRAQRRERRLARQDNDPPGHP